LCPSDNEQNKQEEKEEDKGGYNNILAQEIDSWDKYEYALMEENRLMFNKMLSEFKESEDLVNNSAAFVRL
jgi:hypothetical protein